MACIYILKHEDGTESTFLDEAAFIAHVKKTGLLENSGKKGEPTFSTQSLIDVLRQDKFGEHNFDPKHLKSFQKGILDEFTRLEDEASHFYKIGNIIALVKGLGKGFDNIEAVKKNLKELGIGQEKLSDKTPIDVRYLLTGDKRYLPEGLELYHHEITANNIRTMNEIDALSRTMIMERTPIFLYITDKIIANLNEENMQYGNKIQELKDEISAFAQISAYKRIIAVKKAQTSTLRNSLIYDTENITKNIIDIVDEAKAILPNNQFLSFLLPVPAQIKMSKKTKKKNPRNRDLVNILEGRTRGKIEPEMIASLMDSFAELYNNNETRYHANALFDYLIVKDALMFKNRSFIKMLPTSMFQDLSQGTDIATKLMAANTIEELRRVANDLRNFKLEDQETKQIVSFLSGNDPLGGEIRDAIATGDSMRLKDALFQKVFGHKVNQFYNKYEAIYATDARFQRNVKTIRPFLRTGRSAGIPDSIKMGWTDSTKTKMGIDINIFTKKYKDLPDKTEEDRAKRSGLLNKDIIPALQAVGFGYNPMGEGKDIKHMMEFKKYIRVNNVPGFDKKQYLLFRLVKVNRNWDTFQYEHMTAAGDLVPRGDYARYEQVEEVGTPITTGAADLGTRPTKAELVKFLESQTPTKATTTPVQVSTGEQGKLFNEPSKIVKDHAMSYKMPASENIWGRDTTTLAEAEAGTRTATTRSFALGAVGDIITFEKRPQKYKITAVEQLTEPKVQSREWVENWSRKEGWTVEHFHKVLGGSTVHIGSWQTTFEKVDEAGTPTKTTPTPTPVETTPTSPAPQKMGGLGGIMIDDASLEEGFFDNITDMQADKALKC